MSRRYLLISTLPHLKMIFGEENFDYRCSNATILAILKMIFFPEASLNFMHSKIFSFECCQFFGKRIIVILCKNQKIKNSGKMILFLTFIDKKVLRFKIYEVTLLTHSPKHSRAVVFMTLTNSFKCTELLLQNSCLMRV